MNNSRTKNTKRNVTVSYIYAGLNFLFQFILRTIIVRILGEKYLGLSSLFSAILQVLNMAEMGFSGAIVFNMYKPLAQGDTGTICALLKYYKKVYRTIGIVIFSAGSVLTPCVPRLIRGTYPSEINVYFLYYLYLINTSISYFLFAYKNSLLYATQRMDLSKLAHGAVELAQYVLQIAVLVFFKSYYLYVIVMLLGTAGKNIFAAIMANKTFPEYICCGELSKITKSEVISRVKGLLICNISGTTYTTFDSIILSSCLGLTSVAIYNNYTMIFSCTSKIIGYIRSAMEASVGNSVAKEDKEKNYNDMLIWQYLFSGIALWCATCLFNLYQPFMKLWMGEKMLLPMLDVALLSAWLAVTVIQNAYFLYLSGNGLWWELRWPYICSTVFNLVANIILGKLLGTTGIILASFISSFVFCFLWQSAIIFKLYFQRTTKEYMIRQFGFFVLMAIATVSSWIICSYISLSGITELVVKAVICSVISISVFLVFTCRTENYKNALSLAKRIVKI